MATRRLVWRCASLYRSRPMTTSSLVRSQSVLTKEREPPNGFLFNEKPRLPGAEKRQLEDWEDIWYRWWVIIFALCGVMFYYKPDTSPQTWARQEALKRLAAKESGEDVADSED